MYFFTISVAIQSARSLSVRMHVLDYASSLNSDQVYWASGFNQRAHRFSLSESFQHPILQFCLKLPN